MDILAHTLWTTAAFYKKYKTDKKLLFLSAFFGVVPDLISFVPVFVYGFLSSHGFMELVGSSHWVVRYATESYNYTHSAISFVLVLFIILAIRKGKMWWPIWGWALHIGIDIFTHRGFYETPFLFPLSQYKFSHGISWAHPTFMIINYSALAVIYIVWYLVLRKRN